VNRLSSTLLCLALLSAGKAAAQSAQAVSLQISGLYNAVFGDVFDSFKHGVGGEAQIRYTPGALSIGAGFQYTTHDRPPVLPGDPPSLDARLYGAFVEPRYRIHTGSNVLAPYVSARLSLLKVGFSDSDFSLSSPFVQINGGGGLLYRLGSRVNLDLGATFGYNRVGEGTLRSQKNNTSTHVESSSGTNLMMRLGFAFGIGG
jgi:Outer membrane protein beta-barrel domain